MNQKSTRSILKGKKSAKGNKKEQQISYEEKKKRKNATFCA
jgi:hypothetical protein